MTCSGIQAPDWAISPSTSARTTPVAPAAAAAAWVCPTSVAPPSVPAWPTSTLRAKTASSLGSRRRWAALTSRRSSREASTRMAPVRPMAASRSPSAGGSSASRERTVRAHRPRVEDPVREREEIGASRPSGAGNSNNAPGAHRPSRAVPTCDMYLERRRQLAEEVVERGLSGHIVGGEEQGSFDSVCPAECVGHHADYYVRDAGHGGRRPERLGPPTRWLTCVAPRSGPRAGAP
jgi:hypothetical protein